MPAALHRCQLHCILRRCCLQARVSRAANGRDRLFALPDMLLHQARNLVVDVQTVSKVCQVYCI